MRDSQHQTPQRDQISSVRRTKSSSDLNRNPRKVTNKSLNPAFKAVSEEDAVVLESIKEISEVSADNPFSESAENFITLVKPADTYSSDQLSVADLSSPALSSASIISLDKHEVYNALDAHQVSSPEVDVLKKIECVGVDLVIKHLTEARVRVLNSKDIGPSKKLLDALISIIIDEFYGGLYNEKDWLDKLLSNKIHLVLLSFMVGIFIIFVSWISNSDANSYLMGPTPTPT